MRMHPRLKARRGRFGAGGLKGPVVRITEPAGGTLILVGSPASASFSGTAADDLQGDISSSILWHVGTVGSPALAVGASVDLGPFLTIGSPAAANVVIAQAIDAGGLVGQDQITVNVGVSP